MIILTNLLSSCFEHFNYCFAKCTPKYWGFMFWTIIESVVEYWISNRIDNFFYFRSTPFLGSTTTLKKCVESTVLLYITQFVRQQTNTDHCRVLVCITQNITLPSFNIRLYCSDIILCHDEKEIPNIIEALKKKKSDELYWSLLSPCWLQYNLF